VTPVRAADLLAALAFATDLGTDQPPEHALRVCLVAMRLGEELGVAGDDLWHVALLHGIGCTADSPEAAAKFGDDRGLRSAMAAVDMAKPPALMGGLWRASTSPVNFARAVVAGPGFAREGLRAHCEVGSRLADRLGLGEAVHDGLWHVFERWDGKGFPRGVAGDAIPLIARVLHVARDAVVLERATGPGEAVAAIRERAGSAYDPSVAAAAVLPGALAVEEVGWQEALDLGPRRPLAAPEVDSACAVAGDFADMKSTWFLGHSQAVSELSEAAAWRVGLGAEQVAVVRRAALLADLGRVAISTAVWDRRAGLGDAARERVRQHPYFTERALARCEGLAAEAAVAARHQERLDGSGYHRGCGGADLDASARLVGAADAFCAMTADRPHRRALAPEAAAEQLNAGVRAGVYDAAAVDAVLSAAGQRGERAAVALPAGLSAREAQVLRLIARGATNRVAAGELGLSPKTVGHHVQNVYSKLGVSTRAAAALFAREHGLL
jgi:HD-GYP domain-containing protein (c-di-GMP phosphodiesterase class II)